MTIKILIVDDSYFFRKRLCELFDDHPDITVVATAENGEDALAKVARFRPDLITMDHEMPVMDGVTAVRQIMKHYPTPILMISALTYKGASITLEALEAGALDFVAKLGVDGSNPFLDKKFLCEQVLQLVANVQVRRSEKPASYPQAYHHENSLLDGVQLVVIGASTGGPVAVQDLLCKLPKNFPIPIVVAIHMPENFTQAYANRLARICYIDVKEAENGDPLIAGQALIAPGGKLLKITKNGANGHVRVEPKNSVFNFAPSVDYLFQTAGDSFGEKVLAIVLTGMGSDGCDGAKKLRANNAIVWAQDKESSVIHGMPGMIEKAKLANQIMNIDEMFLGLKSLNG